MSWTVATRVADSSTVSLAATDNDVDGADADGDEDNVGVVDDEDDDNRGVLVPRVVTGCCTDGDGVALVIIGMLSLLLACSCSI